VDQPLVLNRMFGPRRLRSQGARNLWLAPTSFYTEAMVTVMNSAGGTTSSFRSDESSEIHGGVPLARDVLQLTDMLVVPRVAASFDLNDTQTLLLGASAAFGPNNSGPDAKTRIYGADVYWKWKSPRAAAGFPFVSLQGEIMSRRYDAASRVSAETPGSRCRPRRSRTTGPTPRCSGHQTTIVAGLRGEYASGNEAAFESPLRAHRFRLSPNLTWYPTEFSKFRLQYNYDNRRGIGRDHSILAQFEFVLGAHAAHKF
jgi:hypothetical protein